MKKFILALFGVLPLGIMVLSQDVSAVSDYSVVQTQNVQFYVCDDSSTTIPHCSDYSYLSIENTGDPYSQTSTGPIINNSLYGGLGVSGHIYLSLSGVNSIRVNGFQTPAGIVGDINVTYTLTSSVGITPTGSLTITSNGTFNVSSYAEAIIDVPYYDSPPFVQIVIDAFWQYHTYFAGAVVSLIAIFLVYRLIRGRLR